MNAQTRTTVIDSNGLQVQILSVTEAFQSLLDGKNVLARCDFNGNGDEGFEALSEYPADIFAKPHIEFGIKVEMVNINGHEFTKPLTLDEVAPDQEIYFVGATGKILKGKFVSENTDLVDAINNGSVQRDEHNARIHMHAIHSAFGIQNKVIEVVETDFASNDDEPKKPRRGRKPKEEKPVSDESPVIDTPAADPAPLSEAANDDEPPVLSSIMKEIDDTTDLDTLSLISKRILKYQKYFINDELHALQIKISQHKEYLSQLDLLPTSDEYQKQLNDLVTRAQNAKTVGEANELVEETTSWTEEQRRPLLTAIHGRIIWLNDPTRQKNTDTTTEPPSLMVQLQTAPNLDELERLKLEVLNKPLIIQSGLMQYYHKRRSELLKIGINDE